MTLPVTGNGYLTPQEVNFQSSQRQQTCLDQAWLGLHWRRRDPKSYKDSEEDVLVIMHFISVTAIWYTAHYIQDFLAAT
jgi:hypothetical protein